MNENTEHAAIGQRVKTLIAQRGMPQKDLAAALDVSETAMSRALKGERGFASIELARAADLLDADLHWLITGEEDPMRPRLAARHDYDPATRERSNDGLEADKTILDDVVLAYRQAYPEPIQPAPLPDTGEAMRAALEATGPDFVRDFANRIEENLGVDIVRLTGLHTDYSLTIGGRRVIVTKSTGNWGRANFSLAHELGHLALGHHDHEHEVEQHERDAHKFAVELLMPRSLMESFDWADATASDVAAFLWERGVGTAFVRNRLDSLNIAASAEAMAVLDRKMPGALRPYERKFGESVTLGTLRIFRSPIDERMQDSTQTRFPQTLISAHRELVDAGQLRPYTLAWMLQMDPEDLEPSIEASEDDVFVGLLGV